MARIGVRARVLSTVPDNLNQANPRVASGMPLRTRRFNFSCLVNTI